MLVRQRRDGAATSLLTAVLLSAMCCSLGHDRSIAADADDGEKLPLAGGASTAGERQNARRVKEEVLRNRRGPAWLAKLPQKLQKGDSGNRPFAVQDARVAGGLKSADLQSSISPARRGLRSPDSNDQKQVIVSPAPPMGNALSPVRARNPEESPGWDGRVLAYDQEQMWRTRAREAWNSMLENARVGILSKGKLIVEPRLRGAVSSVMAAALTGDVHELMVALDQDGAHIGVTNGVGETPLMLAAISGNSECMAILLARGAEVDTRDVHGWTALMKAVALGDDKAVGFLLAAGADTEVRNAANQTACLIAGAWGRQQAERLLISAGACQSPPRSTPTSDGAASSGGSGADQEKEEPPSRHQGRATLLWPSLKKHAGGRVAVVQEDSLEEDPLLMKGRRTRTPEHQATLNSDPHRSMSEEGGRGWKQEADVRLQWQQVREKEAEDWIKELAVNHERHLTQYRISTFRV